MFKIKMLDSCDFSCQTQVMIVRQVQGSKVTVQHHTRDSLPMLDFNLELRKIAGFKIKMC